jgi:hypothetical protein
MSIKKSRKENLKRILGGKLWFAKHYY